MNKLHKAIISLEVSKTITPITNLQGMLRRPSLIFKYHRWTMCSVRSESSHGAAMVNKQKMTGQKEQPIEAFNRLIFLGIPASFRSVECGRITQLFTALKQWKQNHFYTCTRSSVSFVLWVPSCFAWFGSIRNFGCSIGNYINEHTFW